MNITKHFMFWSIDFPLDRVLLLAIIFKILLYLFLFFISYSKLAVFILLFYYVELQLLSQIMVYSSYVHKEIFKQRSREIF